MEGFDCNRIFTSGEVLAGNEFIFDDHCSCAGYVRYRLTEEDWRWVEFVRGKYVIADFIDRNTVDGVLHADIEEMSKALDDDWPGVGKAMNLSDSSALQRLFFLCYREDCEGRDTNENEI